jgi:hypothetical protein
MIWKLQLVWKWYFHTISNEDSCYFHTKDFENKFPVCLKNTRRTCTFRAKTLRRQVTIRKKGACELNKSHIISTDEDPGLRIDSFAVINLRGVSTNEKYYNYKEVIKYNKRPDAPCIFQVVVSLSIRCFLLLTLPTLAQTRHGFITLENLHCYLNQINVTWLLSASRLFACIGDRALQLYFRKEVMSL